MPRRCVRCAPIFWRRCCEVRIVLCLSVSWVCRSSYFKSKFAAVLEHGTSLGTTAVPNCTNANAFRVSVRLGVYLRQRYPWFTKSSTPAGRMTRPACSNRFSSTLRSVKLMSHVDREQAVRARKASCCSMRQHEPPCRLLPNQNRPNSIALTHQHCGMALCP